MPLCEIVASFRRRPAVKCFRLPCARSSSSSGLLFTGLSTVTKGWEGEERGGGPRFCRRLGPIHGNVFPRPLSSGKFSEGFLLGGKIDGTKMGPGTPPLRVPLFESRTRSGPFWPALLSPGVAGLSCDTPLPSGLAIFNLVKDLPCDRRFSRIHPSGGTYARRLSTEGAELGRGFTGTVLDFTSTLFCIGEAHLLNLR